VSLRELPPEQAITSRWRHLRYVPLAILVVLVILATVVGVAVKRSQPAPTAEPPSASEEPVADRLPDECHRPVAPPTTQPWAAANKAASEEVWVSHADDLATPYVLGEDGWVFWGDIQNNNFSQAIGRRTLSAEELSAWHTYLANLDTELSAEGIELYVVIAPAKWAIYPENLPEWAKAIRGPGPLDQLMEVGGDLPLVDLRAPLTEESSETQTYSRVNSHWSSFGAYTGWNAIADCIVANQPDVGLEPLPLEGVTLVDDFNEYGDYDIELETPDWTEPVFAEPLAPVEISAAGADPVTVDGSRWTSFDDLPATTHTEGAPSDASVLFVSDSFGVVMSPYIQQAFTDIRTLRHNLDGDPSIRPDIADVALATRPDIVILEITQRHLNLPPTP